MFSIRKDRLLKLRSELTPSLPQNIAELHDKTITFQELVEYLASHNENTKGANVLVPETIVFLDGRPKCVIRYDRVNKELKGISKKSVMVLPKLMKIMLAVHYAKRKVPIVSKVKSFYNPRTSDDSNKKKRMDEVRLSDAIVVRVKYKRSIEFLTYKEFISMMMERANDKIWRDVLYIENCITISTFLPENFIYIFIAPIDKKNPKTKIIYNAKEVRENDSFKAKAHAICITIANYLSKVRNLVFNS